MKRAGKKEAGCCDRAGSEEGGGETRLETQAAWTWPCRGVCVLYRCLKPLACCSEQGSATDLQGTWAGPALWSRISHLYHKQAGQGRLQAPCSNSDILFLHFLPPRCCPACCLRLRTLSSVNTNFTCGFSISLPPLWKLPLAPWLPLLLISPV